MALTLNCLIVDTNKDAVEKLTKALWPEIQFSQADFSSSISDAFQKLVDLPYNVCFMASAFSKDLEAFFADMRKLGRDKTCAFVQFWDKFPPKYDKSQAVQLGFSTAITKDISAEDKLVLKDVLRLELHHHEVRQKVADVENAVQFLVKELDRVAKERKRGKKEKFDKLIRNFIAAQNDFDEEVFTEYVSSLTDKSTSAKSFEKSQLSVPAQVLARKLPFLTDQGYSGMSLRTWERLLKKYGVQQPGKAEAESETQAQPAKEAPDPGGKSE